MKTITKQSNSPQPNSPQSDSPQPPKSADRKSLFQPGGTYFHSGAIMGKKNVFVTSAYIDLLVNAIKMAELKNDIKNLAYVVMPNYFCWMFKLSSRQENPVAIYADVKKQVAVEILKNLKEEVKNGQFEIDRVFQGNRQVTRTTPERLLWSFAEYAKGFEGNKKYKVWAPKGQIMLLDSDDLIQQKLAVIKAAPVRERWQLATRVEDYPYFYVAEELENDKQTVSQFVQSILNVKAQPLPV